MYVYVINKSARHFCHLVDVFFSCTWIWSWVRSWAESYSCTRNDWAILVYILVIYCFLILKIEILICCFDERMLHRFKWKIPHFSLYFFIFPLSSYTFPLPFLSLPLPFLALFFPLALTFALALTFDVYFFLLISFKIVFYKMDERQTSFLKSKSKHVHGRSLLKPNRK